MFHSRNPQYRFPTGAVQEGANVHFKISMSRDLRCSAAALLVDTGDPEVDRMLTGYVRVIIGYMEEQICPIGAERQ